MLSHFGVFVPETRLSDFDALRRKIVAACVPQLVRCPLRQFFAL